MPVLGYGVGTAWFKSAEKGQREELKESIKAALDAGFRHIDDAEMYGNSAITGEAVREWLAEDSQNRRRSDLFITQKVADFDARHCSDTCDRLLQETGASGTGL